MPAAKRPGVRVRGSCKAGHVTETTSDPGRLTWQGECSHASCTERVNAKRIPKDATPAPPAHDAGGTRVVRIADYDATASGAQGDHGGLVVADIAPAPAGGAGEPAEGAAGPADPLNEDGERSTLGQRLRGRRRRAAVRSARREYQHPLGI